jgi:hypothetical protein
MNISSWWDRTPHPVDHRSRSSAFGEGLVPELPRASELLPTRYRYQGRASPSGQGGGHRHRLGAMSCSPNMPSMCSQQPRGPVRARSARHRDPQVLDGHERSRPGYQNPR